MYLSVASHKQNNIVLFMQEVALATSCILMPVQVFFRTLFAQ